MKRKNERRKENEATYQTAITRARVSSSKLDYTATICFVYLSNKAQLKGFHKKHEGWRAP